MSYCLPLAPREITETLCTWSRLRVILSKKVSEKQEPLPSALPDNKGSLGLGEEELVGKWKDFSLLNGKQQRVDACNSKYNEHTVFLRVFPRGLSWNIVWTQSYGIYIVSQGFLKGDIHPAPDIPSYEHGCFVTSTMPKDGHDYVRVVWKLKHRNLLATYSLERRVPPSPGDFGFASKRTAATHYTLQIQHNYVSLTSFSKILHWRKLMLQEIFMDNFGSLKKKPFYNINSSRCYLCLI